MSKLLCIVLLAYIAISVVVRAECEYEGKKIKVGEKTTGRSGDQCVLIQCYEDGAASVLTCGLQAWPAGCKDIKLISELTKPYPECCPKAECID